VLLLSWQPNLVADGATALKKLRVIYITLNKIALGYIPNTYALLFTYKYPAFSTELPASQQLVKEK
jgi:hypothetical protein